MQDNATRWIAFAQSRRIAAGAPREVASAVKAFVGTSPDLPVLVFDARSSEPVELDLRGMVEDVLARLPIAPQDAPQNAEEPAPPVRSAGRPKLGVTAREVTLLPRHWTWLATQPGGASVALRKLVEQAMRANAEIDRVRLARESAYRFMTAVAGNEANHDEAVRALFAGDLAAFARWIDCWPADVRAHALALARTADQASDLSAAS